MQASKRIGCERANIHRLHELSRQGREELEEFTDDIAERAVELGGVAEGTIQVTRSIPAHGYR